MWKVIQKILVGILMSMFFYPFKFKFIPGGINTKMILAVVGLICFGLDMAEEKNRKINTDIVVAAIFALLFSVLCFMSEVICGTTDGSYSTYFASFFVWIFAAYAICTFIRKVHNTADLRTITYYLAAVAVFQCILAQLVDNYPAVQNLVDSFIEQGQDRLHDINRLYGIGAALDDAGVRFAVTSLLISYFIIDNGKEDGHTKDLWFLYISFLIIAVFGNMIARTTTVGVILGVAYMLLQIILNARVNLQRSRIRSFFLIFFLVLLATPFFISQYNTNPEMRFQMRFAFEGFFNWAENGEFSTASTDKLDSTMWLWPETPQGWFIGTGIFGSWVYGTDIGYCRLILYCGLLGFSVFSLFFVHNAISVSKKYPHTILLSLLLLSMTFIIWIKVATDIFQIYALLYCADAVIRSDKKEAIPAKA